MAIKVTATIRNIAFPAFEQHGFSYDEKVSSKNYWTFSRQGDDLVQFISINKSNHSPNSISLFLSTSKDRAGIMGGDLAQRAETWWEYNSQDEFTAVIREIVEIAIERGLPWFEFSGTKIPPIPEQVGRGCLANKNQLVEEFIKNYGLDFDASDAALKLQEIIYNHRMGNEFDWEFIGQAGAFFGELIRNRFAGQWQWDDEFSEPIIMEVGGRSDVSVHPLFYVIRYWCNPYNRLLTIYGYLGHVLHNNMPYLGR